MWRRALPSGRRIASQFPQMVTSFDSTEHLPLKSVRVAGSVTIKLRAAFRAILRLTTPGPPCCSQNSFAYNGFKPPVPFQLCVKKRTKKAWEERRPVCPGLCQEAKARLKVFHRGRQLAPRRLRVLENGSMAGVGFGGRGAIKIHDRLTKQAFAPAKLGKNRRNGAFARSG